MSQPLLIITIIYIKIDSPTIMEISVEVPQNTKSRTTHMLFLYHSWAYTRSPGTVLHSLWRVNEED
jgi:hypothetical protein